jgi:RNA polymerase sigma factor (sigma-70 family)
MAARVPELFEETYMQFAPRLRKIAMRKFGIPHAEAEPLVHDVFATFFTHAADVHAVEPYLVGAICNAARKHLKRIDTAGELFFCDDRPCAATPSRDLLREIEQKLLLRRMLARVGCRCRDLFDRYYLNGETSRAIAEALNTTPATILVLLHKCRKRALAAYRSLTETTE